jgi:hypothetical protein
MVAVEHLVVSLCSHRLLTGTRQIFLSVLVFRDPPKLNLGVLYGRLEL